MSVGPGSRAHAVGNVYTRISGLLRSGALNQEERPIWYDVYQAFPPRIMKDNSLSDRLENAHIKQYNPLNVQAKTLAIAVAEHGHIHKLQTKQALDEIRKAEEPVKVEHDVPVILYIEDYIRAEFFKVFGNPEVMDLTEADGNIPIVQLFINLYMQKKREGNMTGEDLFDCAAKELQSKGYPLKSLSEIKKEKAEVVKRNTEQKIKYLELQRAKQKHREENKLKMRDLFPKRN